MIKSQIFFFICILKIEFSLAQVQSPCNQYQIPHPTISGYCYQSCQNPQFQDCLSSKSFVPGPYCALISRRSWINLQQNICALCKVIVKGFHYGVCPGANCTNSQQCPTSTPVCDENNYHCRPSNCNDTGFGCLRAQQWCDTTLRPPTCRPKQCPVCKMEEECDRSSSPPSCRPKQCPVCKTEEECDRSSSPPSCRPKIPCPKCNNGQQCVRINSIGFCKLKQCPVCEINQICNKQTNPPSCVNVNWCLPACLSGYACNIFTLKCQPLDCKQKCVGVNNFCDLQKYECRPATCYDPGFQCRRFNQVCDKVTRKCRNINCHDPGFPCEQNYKCVNSSCIPISKLRCAANLLPCPYGLKCLQGICQDRV